MMIPLDGEIFLPAAGRQKKGLAMDSFFYFKIKIKMKHIGNRQAKIVLPKPKIQKLHV